MRKMAGIAVLAAASSITAGQVAAHVAPPTPEQQVMIARQNALENAVRDRFSDGTFNRVRDMYGSIIVAEERRGRLTVPRVLTKDEHGWHELRANARREVPRRVAHELDRLLIDADLWAEPAYLQDVRCANPQLVVLRYAGRDKFGRQCVASGLAGRAAEVAATFRIPAAKATTTAPPPGPHDERLTTGLLENLTGHVGNRARDMVWAWGRQSLAGAVDPYAEDAIVEFADGRVLRGRMALVEWMWTQQDWSAPGLPTQGIPRGVRHQQGMIRPPDDRGIITEMREIRWEDNGRPMRRTYSASWRNNDGLWQIVYERVSEDKPVIPGERRVWD